MTEPRETMIHQKETVYRDKNILLGCIIEQNFYKSWLEGKG